MKHLTALICLCRPQQWSKNTFVFLPMFFSGRLFDTHIWLVSLYAFISCSLASSSVYCLNDIIDASADRLHPIKRHRPIAAGRIKTIEALIIMVFLFLSSIVISYFTIGWEVAILILSYMLLNIAYCLKLKQISIIDVFIVAFGFVLRVIIGGVATDITLSPWIILMTFLLTLFLAFAKRRDDVLIYDKDSTLGYGNIRYTA